MFGPKVELTESEKIDYIYKKLRAKARTDTIMTFIKICFVGFVIYFYVYIVPKLNEDELIDKYIAPHLSKIVQKTVGKTVQDVGNNMINSFDKNSIDKAIQDIGNSATRSVIGTNSPNLNITNIGTTGTQRRRNIPNNSSNGINITPEMIDAVKNSMNK